MQERSRASWEEQIRAWLVHWQGFIMYLQFNEEELLMCSYGRHSLYL